MIEFKETFNFDGMTIVRLRADGMPDRGNSLDYQYTITVFPDGRSLGKSRAWGKGSTRHHQFKTYADAQVHAVAWAMRQIARERKMEQLRARDAEILAAIRAGV